MLPPTWSRGNPVDIIGDAPGRRYADALGVLLEDPGVDAVLVMNCPTAVASSVDAAEAVVAAAQRRPRIRRLITSWLGEAAAVEQARRLFEARRCPPTTRRAGGARPSCTWSATATASER